MSCYCNLCHATIWNQLPPALRVDQSFNIFVNDLEVFLFEKVERYFYMQ